MAEFDRANEPMNKVGMQASRWEYVRRRNYLAWTRYRMNRAYYLFSRALGGPDFLNELDYWEYILTENSDGLFNQQIRDAAFPAELRSCVSELRLAGVRLPRLLEVGSGPLSILASGVDENLFTIVAADPLACQYRDLLKLYDVTYPIQPVPAGGESLVKSFGPQSFDIVYSSNALDHTSSPQQCIQQMCRVVRPGGFILLEGFVREGSHGNW